MRALRTILPALLLPTLLVTGCNGDDDSDLTPADDSSSSSSTGTGDSDDPNSGDDDKQGGGQDDPPPPPKGIKLTNNENAAYNKAREDYAEWGRIQDKLTRNPKSDAKTYRVIRSHMYNPAAEQFWQSIQRYEKVNVRILGGSKVRWDVPIKVDLDARVDGNAAPVVSWKRCIVRKESFRVMHGDKEIPQPRGNERSVNRIEVRADSTGYWRVTDAKQVDGQC